MGTKTKHLGGPWKANRVLTGWTIDAGNGEGANYIADVHCHVGPARDDARVEANARLIAAAPDLLEALASLVAISPRDCPWGCEAGHRESCPVSVGYAALAKAEAA